MSNKTRIKTKIKTENKKQTWGGIIHQYQDHLPVNDLENVVSLFEGNTPLVQLKNCAKKYDIQARWYAKFEGMNPTGSFKDRGMTMAITKAKEEGAKVVICASTGNTSASAAAEPAALAGRPVLAQEPASELCRAL